MTITPNSSGINTSLGDEGLGQQPLGQDNLFHSRSLLAGFPRGVVLTLVLPV